MKEPQTLGRWLKKLRAEQDLTQEMLAEQVGCSLVTLRSFEIGSRRPSREMAERIADTLQVPTEQRAEFLRLARQPLETHHDAPSEQPAKPEPVPPVASGRDTLPPVLTPLIGRDAECNALQTLLTEEHARLVTIIGAGGMGKTRLALAVAARLSSHFADGVVFVPLAPLRLAAHLPGAVANALQLAPGSRDPSQQVLTALAARRMLLVLDGFEALLHDGNDDAVGWINRLLQQSAHVQILTTSRERLRLRSERSFELGGLTLPTLAAPIELADAVLLFLERAQQVTPDFQLESSNSAAVARICQLVDGMPLGLELAAAWVNVLSPEEIARELETNLDLLARANRDATPRHSSMRAVLDHSWAWLDDKERMILGRLAVFQGGCTREAAQVVAQATLPHLAGLIDKSLLRRRQVANQARYELHEVVRQYADEKRRTALPPENKAKTLAGLAEDAAWLDHYTYFYKLAVTAQPHLSGREQLQWLQVLDAELANLRAVLDRCLSTQDSRRGLQLANSLADYWYMRGYHREGLQRLLDFLRLAPTELPENEVANGYVAATILAIAGGNYQAAHSYLDHSLAMVRRLGDPMALTRLLRYGGLIALHEADYAAAERHASEALQLAMAANNYSDWATTLTHLAEIALVHQNYARAQELNEQAVQILRQIEDKNQLAGSLRRLAQVLIYQGEWPAAREKAQESLALNNEVGDQRGTAASLVIVAALLAATAQWSAVAQLLGAADHLLRQAQASLLPADQLVYADLWQKATAHLPDFATWYDAGRTRLAQPQRPPYHLDWVQHLFV